MNIFTSSTVVRNSRPNVQLDHSRSHAPLFSFIFPCIITRKNSYRWTLIIWRKYSTLSVFMIVNNPFSLTFYVKRFHSWLSQRKLSVIFFWTTTLLNYGSIFNNHTWFIKSRSFCFVRERCAIVTANHSNLQFTVYIFTTEEVF